MNQTTKKISGFLVAMLLMGGGFGFWMYNKPHQDLAVSQVDVQLTAAELFASFEQDEAAANQQYLDQLIEVTGKVAEMTSTADGGAVVLLRGEADMFGVSCSFLAEESATVQALEAGQTITIRGICAGYLMDVSLSRCIVRS